MTVRARGTPRTALVVATLGSTMAFLDGTIVNVALPVMQRAMRATSAQMQWVVEAYALFLAALVLVGGALGDRFGRKRVFLVGVLAFAGASMACGLAPTVTILTLARSIQGVGAALLVPGSLALISAAYDEHERGGAIGRWSSASSITAAVGPVLGGFIVSHASWRWIFFLNAPIAIVVLLLARGVDETRDDQASPTLDVPGASLAVLGLGAVVYALLESVAWPGLVGVGLLVAFVVVEGRVAHPMVSLQLFRNRAFAITNVLTALLYAALGGALYFLPFALLQVQHYSPTQAGAALLPFIVILSVMSPWAGRLVTRRGARLPLVVGPALAAAGFALLADPAIGGSYFTTFFPGIVTLGVGMGLTVAPLTMVVMGSVETRHAGVASGINNAVSRTAGLLAVAALGVVLVARFDRALDRALATSSLSDAARAVVETQRAALAGADLSALEEPLRSTVRHAFDEAFVTAFSTTTLAGAGLAFLAALSALFLGPGAPITTSSRTPA